MSDRDAPPPKQEETLEVLERRVRAGLGPEAALVDVLMDGIAAETFAESEFGRVLIKDVSRRATAILQDMVSDVANLTPDIAFRQQVALSQELGILRRIAALVAGGKMAERRMGERDAEFVAHAGPPLQTDESQDT